MIFCYYAVYRTGVRTDTGRLPTVCVNFSGAFSPTAIFGMERPPAQLERLMHSGGQKCLITQPKTFRDVMV